MPRDVKSDIQRRTLRRRLKRWTRRFLIFLGVFLASTGLISGVLGLEPINIAKIQIEGNSVVSSDNIESFIEDQVAGSYFSLFPKRNIFIYPENSIKQKALADFERLKEFELKREGLSAIAAKVKERKPYKVWCPPSSLGVSTSAPVEVENATSSPDNSEVHEEGIKEEVRGEDPSKNNCYFLDKTGFIFDKAPSFTDKVYFKYYTIKPTESERSPKGEKVLSDKNFIRVESFLNLLKKLDFKPVKIVHKQHNDYEIYLSSGGGIRFSLDQDLEEVAEALQVSLNSEVFEEKSLDQLQYLDLRFNNKVFYKFKQ